MGVAIGIGDIMFHIVNAYKRAGQFKGLPAETSYPLQRVGGNILGMLMGVVPKPDES